MRKLFLGNTNGLKRGKTIIATPITRADTYRSNGQGWQSAQALPHNTPVDEVNHFGRHSSVRGELVRIESLDNPPVNVEIVDIRAVETDKLIDADFVSMGYRDRADYMADWGDVFGGRLWIMRIRRVEATQEQPRPSKPQIL